MDKIILITIFLFSNGDIQHRKIEFKDDWTVCQKMAERMNILPAEPPAMVTMSYCEVQ